MAKQTNMQDTNIIRALSNWILLFSLKSLLLKQSISKSLPIFTKNKNIFPIIYECLLKNAKIIKNQQMTTIHLQFHGKTGKQKNQHKKSFIFCLPFFLKFVMLLKTEFKESFLLTVLKKQGST